MGSKYNTLPASPTDGFTNNSRGQIETKNDFSIRI